MTKKFTRLHTFLKIYSRMWIVIYYCLLNTSSVMATVVIAMADIMMW